MTCLGSSVDESWMFQHPRFFNISSSLVETRRKVATASVVLSFPQFNRTGVIPQKLVTTRLADIKLVSKSLR